MERQQLRASAGINLTNKLDAGQAAANDVHVQPTRV